jgi:hypothetical protein
VTVSSFFLCFQYIPVLLELFFAFFFVAASVEAVTILSFIKN